MSHTEAASGTRVLLVTENASIRQGGEASLAYYFFKKFLAQGLTVTMIVHERCRDELAADFPDQQSCIRYISDTQFQRSLARLGNLVPRRISELLVDGPMYLSTQYRTKQLAATIVEQEGITIIHQPTPIGPRFPSLMHDMGVPVVMGPLCGGMEYPPAFKHRDGVFAHLLTPVSRALATALSGSLFPGRARAAALLVAHCTTRSALPRKYAGRVHEVVESGVDLDMWQRNPAAVQSPPRETRFVYVGQVRRFKGTDFLIDAFWEMFGETNATLDIVGDGYLRAELEERVRECGMTARVTFHGWQSREYCADVLARSDVLVLPSLRECGGTVILEAMAMGLPVISADWGGPAKYVAHERTGLLIGTESERAFRRGLVDAMRRLDADPVQRETFGAAALTRVRSADFDWDNKVRIVTEILQTTQLQGASPRSHHVP
jgi:glycosyltransferase involved in cell wall biosynthesis